MDYEKLINEIETMETENETANGIIQSNYISNCRYTDIANETMN